MSLIFIPSQSKEQKIPPKAGFIKIAFGKIFYIPARNATSARQSPDGSSRMADGQSVSGGPKTIITILKKMSMDQIKGNLFLVVGGIAFFIFISLLAVFFFFLSVFFQIFFNFFKAYFCFLYGLCNFFLF